MRGPFEHVQLCAELGSGFVRFQHGSHAAHCTSMVDESPNVWPFHSRGCVYCDLQSPHTEALCNQLRARDTR